MSGTLSCTTVITRAVSRLTAMAYLGRRRGGGEEEVRRRRSRVDSSGEGGRVRNYPRERRVFQRSAGKVEDLGDLMIPWQEEQRRRRASPLPWLPSTSSEEVEEVETVRCPFTVREGEESAVARE